MIGRLAFPLAIAGVLLLERVATYLLGIIPSSPTLWWIWLELRPLFRVVWHDVEGLGIHSMGVQAASVLAVASLFVVLTAGRRGQFWSFLGNHLALLFVASCAWVASVGQIASVGVHPIEFGTEIAMANMSWFALILVSAGVVACGRCHWSYLRLAATGRRS